MDRLKLTAKKREILGRKVKKLRKEGILPANIYGKNIKSLGIEIALKDFTKVYQEVGETGLVDLSVEKETNIRPVLIHNVQRDPVEGTFLHVDFHQVSLTEKVKATISVELIGESPAETQKLGILVQIISEIEVEALPADLPEHFQVDVSKLANVGDQIKVIDLMVDKKKIELKVDENQIVAKIEPLAKEEAVAPPPTAEMPVEAEAVSGEKKPAEEAGKPEEAKSKEESKVPEEPKETKEEKK